MAGASIEIKGLEEVKARFKELADKIKNPKPILEEIGQIVADSVLKNFDVGGRPDTWTPSLRAQRTGDKTLIKTGRLMRSVKYKVSVRDQSVRVGTNVKYGAIHQFGGVIYHPQREMTLNFKTYKRGKNAGRTLFAKLKKADFQQTAHGKS